MIRLELADVRSPVALGCVCVTMVERLNSFRITPIGTCRIHTPLNRAASRYDVEIDRRRNYGFVHTSEEALQQLRFLQGEKQFRPEVLPLVFRGDAEQLERQSWELSDYHVVEISSGKRITCGSDAIQINYLYRHFADFFARKERARQFWNHVRDGHREALRDFLEKQAPFQLLSPADRELLASLNFEQQTFRSVKADMAEMVERIGVDRLLFVTHVNATTVDGEVMPARDRLIRWVKLAAEQLGAEVFDPTDAMREFGQETALEERGVDLTHYTPAFSDRVYDLIHQQHIAPRLGSVSRLTGDEQSREVAAIASKVEGMIQLDFFGASRELHRSL